MPTLEATAIEERRPTVYKDNNFVAFGDEYPAGLGWCIDDANANCLMVDLPTGGAVDVPVFAVGIDIFRRNLALFDGFTEPLSAVVDADRDSYIGIGFESDDQAHIKIGGVAVANGLVLAAAGCPLKLQNTTDAASNEVLRLGGGNRATPTDDDEVYITFYLDDSTGTQVEFARMTVVATDVTAASQDARFEFAVMVGDTMTNIFTMTSSAAAAVTATVTAPMIFAESVAPAATFCYIVRDNTGDLTLNALANKTINLAIAGTDEYVFSATILNMNENHIDNCGYIVLNAVTPTSGEVQIWNETAGELHLNALVNKTVVIEIADSAEYSFSATSADFNANTIDDVGTISATDAAGPSIANEAATTTNPTLIPNRAEMDTGIGWASDVIHIVLGGASEYSFSTTTADFNANTITDVGTITVTNAAGPTIVNEAATTTNPTLCPNRAEDDTGIGWATDAIYIILGGAEEYGFSTTSLDLNSNTIDEAGTISATNAAGPAILNEAATTTNPTLVPNRAELDTGIGWASDILHVVLGGASEYSFSATILEMNGNALDNCGFIILNAATAPAGTEVYLVNDNSGDLTLSCLTSKVINLAVAGSDVLRIQGTSVYFLQDLYTDRWLPGTSGNTFVGIGVVGAGNLLHYGGGTKGWYNSAFGYQALYSCSLGDFNSAFGCRALYSNTEGEANNAFGEGSLELNITGSGNSGFGDYTIHNNLTGSRNCGFGYAALSQTLGTGNVAVGWGAGNAITTGSYNIIIGYYINAPSATTNYQIEIGDGVNQGRLRSDNAGDWTIYCPSGKVIKLQPDGDTDDYITIDTVSGVPTIYGTGAHLRIGDGGGITTSQSLDSEDDLLITGELEVDGTAFFDSYVWSMLQFQIRSGNMIVMDDLQVNFGSGSDVYIIYETADTDARILLILMDESADSGNNVPVLAFGEHTNLLNANLGLFDAIVEPIIAAIDLDADSYAYIGHSADDVPRVGTNGLGAAGIILTNPKNAAATALSGTQLDVEIDIGGTAYYFTVYPTKAA